MLKHIPIFWKLSVAFMIVSSIVLVVDFYLEGVIDLKSDGKFRNAKFEVKLNHEIVRYKGAF